MTEIRTLAAELDLGDVAGRLSYEEIIKAAGKATLRDDHDSEPDKLSPEELAAVMCRLCSAFAHGRSWASLSWLERQVVRSEGGVITVALLPFVFTSWALHLYEQRRRSLYL